MAVGEGFGQCQGETTEPTTAGRCALHHPRGHFSHNNTVDFHIRYKFSDICQENILF